MVLNFKKNNHLFLADCLEKALDVHTDHLKYFHKYYYQTDRKTFFADEETIKLLYKAMAKGNKFSKYPSIFEEVCYFVTECEPVVNNVYITLEDDQLFVHGQHYDNGNIKIPFKEFEDTYKEEQTPVISIPNDIIEDWFIIANKFDWSLNGLFYKLKYYLKYLDINFAEYLYIKEQDSDLKITKIKWG